MREVDVVHQERVEVELAGGVVLHRHDERIRLRAVDDAPDDVRRLVAEERRREHLDLMIGLEPERPRKAAAERGQHVAQIGAEIREPALEREVEHDVDQRVAQALLQRVVAAIGGRIGVDVLGGDRRAHEDEAVVVVAAPQRLHRDRVEERLGALGLLVVDEEPDEVELHLLPQALAVGHRKGRRSDSRARSSPRSPARGGRRNRCGRRRRAGWRASCPPRSAASPRARTRGTPRSGGRSRRAPGARCRAPRRLRRWSLAAEAIGVAMACGRDWRTARRASRGRQDPNVLQRRMSPVSSPVLNQRSRCSALPCVNDSGTT